MSHWGVETRQECAPLRSTGSGQGASESMRTLAHSATWAGISMDGAGGA